MKVSREKAQENRLAVIETSSRLFRENGFDGVGVSTLMQAAGLTHGGFYKQFTSKDDLIARATRAALGQTRDRMATMTQGAGSGAFETLVRSYLSAEHRDGVGQGCALAALGGDAARHGTELRQVMQQGVEDYLGLLAASGGGPAGREQAIAALTTLVGALVLSRAVEDPGLSQEILQAATAHVLAQCPGNATGHEELR